MKATLLSRGLQQFRVSFRPSGSSHWRQPCRPTIVAGTTLALIASALARDVDFTAEPKAVCEGGKGRITFAVGAPTDVEVAVLDTEGNVVRHLAAGLLGNNAPAPLRKDSLAQSLVWDLKDDDGQVLPPGSTKSAWASGSNPSSIESSGTIPTRSDQFAALL